MSKETKIDRLEVIEPHGPTSRRDAIKWGLAALAGVGVSALAPATAYAAVGNLQYGANNDAGTDGTVLTSNNAVGLQLIGDPESGATLTLENTYVTGSGLLRFWGHALSAKAVSDGDTAIITNTGSGTAVSASSTNGYGVYAKGGKAPLHLVVSSTSGAPTTGAHVLGDVYADKDGVIWVCTAAGTPGTWGSILHSGTNAADTTVNALTAAGAATFNAGATMKGAVVDGAFSMTRSGRKRVSKGKTSATVTVPSGVAVTSNILCTLQNTAGAGVYIRYAKRTSATTFKIYLNKKATTKTAYVAWMILG